MFEFDSLLTTIFPKFVEDLQHHLFTPMLRIIFPDPQRESEPGYKEIRLGKILRNFVKYVLIAIFTAILLYLAKSIFGKNKD